MIEFIQQLINGLSLGAIYALIALGYTMVYGVLRFINFAHGDVFMLGAFAGLYAAPHVLEMCGGPSYGVTAIVLLVAMAACAIIGVVIERLCYSPLRAQPKLTVLITAIGVSLFLENGGQLWFGADPKSFPIIMDDSAIDLPQWFGRFVDLTLTTGQLLVFGVTAALLIALHYIVMHTRLGMAMRAVSFNPAAASLMGVNNDFIISFTFALGSALAGAAGILVSIQLPSVEPLMGVMLGLKAFVAAVLGGIGNLQGAVLGGLLLGVLETMDVGYGSPTYKDAIAFAVLILILLVKPTGLLGKSEREKV